MRILVLSDGKPGHYKKSEAVVKGIRALVDAKVDWLDVRMRLPLYHDVLRWVFRRQERVPSERWLALCYSLPPVPARPHLVLSSGGKTAYVNAWLAARFACPNVFIGDTRGLPDQLFTRIIVHDAAHAGDPRFITSLIPTEVDQQSLRRAAWEYLGTRDQQFQSTRHWTLLIGGNSGGYRFRCADWDALAQAIIALASRHNIRWLVTTSRRTPRSAERMLRRHDVRALCDELVIFRVDRRRVFNALLASGDVIVCTEDSGTMLAEACAAARPVFSIRPQTARPSAALTDMLALYETRRYLKRALIADLHELQSADVATGFQTDGTLDLPAIGRQILNALAPDIVRRAA